MQIIVDVYSVIYVYIDVIDDMMEDGGDGQTHGQTDKRA